MYPSNPAILAVIDRHMQALLVGLRESESLEHIRAHQGSWANANGLMAAYVSVFTTDDPSENNIDAVIDIKFIAANQLHLTADICRSNGEVIAEIASDDVISDTLDGLVMQVDKLAGKAKGQMQDRLVQLLSTG